MLKPEDIEEEITVLSGAVRLMTPTGWKDVLKAYKTKPLPVWRVETSQRFVEAAPEHLLILADGEHCQAQDLLPGDIVVSETGSEEITQSWLTAEPAAPMYDFEIEGPDHVYFSNGLLSHNSSTLIARQRVYADILTNFQSLYITPHTNYLDQYADRFRSMEKLFRFPIRDNVHYKQNKYYKEYPRGNTVSLFRVFESADPIRGHTGNEVIIDEAQHFDPDFMAVVKQCLRAKRLRARYYAGTSLTTDTFLEAKYEAGSRSTWHVPSTDNQGKKIWINLGSQEEILACIKPEGLICPHSGKLLRVATGEFVDEDTAARASGLISYHVPQIIVPEYVEKLSEWAVIWNDFNELPLSKFLQEVMGIPTEEGYREITAKDLEGICVLPESIQARMAKAMSGYYQWVISGCDWGGSDYNPTEGTKASYTAQAIIGVAPDRNLDILHLQTWAGMHYRQIAKEIAENHKKFRGNILVSDDGAGDLYNNFLQESGYILPEKHLVLKYTAPNTALFSKMDTGGTKFLNRYGLNKTESVSSLFEAIKRQPAPRIRCYAWGEARRHLMDFLNVYRNLVETDAGHQKFRYRKHGSKPDDIMHAVNFAYVGSKVVMNEPLIDDRQVRDRLRQMLTGALGGSGQNPFLGVSG